MGFSLLFLFVHREFFVCFVCFVVLDFFKGNRPPLNMKQIYNRNQTNLTGPFHSAPFPLTYQIKSSFLVSTGKPSEEKGRSCTDPWQGLST